MHEDRRMTDDTDNMAVDAGNVGGKKPEPLAVLCLRLANGNYDRAMMMVRMIAAAEAEQAANPQRRLH